MSRPVSNVARLMRRNDVYYVVWYEPLVRRTVRQSLRTADPEFAAQAFAQFKPPVSAAKMRPPETGEKLTWHQWAVKMCRRARGNAKQKKRVCTISPDFIEILLEKQGYRCAVTNIPFSQRESHRNPFGPSIDQISAGRGYTADNVRIVSVIVNTAMNGWGEEPLWRLIHESRLGRAYGNRTRVTNVKGWCPDP